MGESRLKLWMHIVMSLVCAAGSIACLMAARYGTETVRPFQAEEEVKDAGILKQQDERDVTFRLTNSAKAPVEITHIATSCTCTHAEVATRSLQSGESTELIAHLRVRTLRGRIAALINVVYRVGDAQTVQRLPLTITATVEAHYTVAPESIVFKHDGDRKIELQRASITITADEPPLVHILEAYSTHPAIRVEKKTFDESTGTNTIHLIFKPELCIGPSVKAEIVVRTDSKREPIRRLPVRVLSDSDR